MPLSPTYIQSGLKAHLLRRITSASLLVGLLFSPASIILTSSSAYAFGLKRHAKKETARNFFPPVAIINGPISQIDGLDAVTEDDTFEPVALSAVSSPAIQLTPKVKQMEKTINLAKKELNTISSLQQKLDEEDLNALWESTVERNPVIRFSLEKIFTPVDLHNSHSSQFYKKVLSSALQGASLLPMMLPGGSYYSNMAATSGAQALNNIVTGKNKPEVNPLTATEQVQLAGLIDELKTDLIANYHSYKNTLSMLSEAHQSSVKSHSMYTSALKGKSDVARVAATNAYYKALLNETELRQKAILYRLRLERLAGNDAVNNLGLALFVKPSIKTASLNGSPKRHINSTSENDVNTIESSSPSSNSTMQSSNQATLPDGLNSPLEIQPSFTNSSVITPSEPDEHLMLMEDGEMLEFSDEIIMGPPTPEP